jgi:hypothetical protein
MKIILGAVVPLLLSACAANLPQIDTTFGEAARTTFARQIARPSTISAANPSVGMDATAMLEGYYRYIGRRPGQDAQRPSRKSDDMANDSTSGKNKPSGYGDVISVNPKTGEPFINIGDGMAVGVNKGTPAVVVGSRNSYTDPQTGVRYEGVAGGVVNTTNGQFSQDVGSGWVNTGNGIFTPKQ